MNFFKSVWNTTSTYKFINNIPKKCKYWKCDEMVYPPYKTCLSCEEKLKFQANYGKYNNKKKFNNKYKREYSSKWNKGDKDALVFFVYILQLNNKSYYAGQTRELRQRYIQHKEGRVITTKYKNPRLVWYQAVFSRNTATKIELELKKLIDNNPREIRRQIMAFQDINALIRK